MTWLLTRKLARWSRGVKTWTLYPTCLMLYEPNEADMIIVWGLFYVGGWHFGWPEVF